MGQWSKYYKTAAWKHRRLAHIKREPLCRMCLAQGRVHAAQVADHVAPHRGSWALFIQGELQSLCYSHHNKDKQAEEIADANAQPQCDADGYPTDGRW